MTEHVFRIASTHGKRVQALGGAKNHAVVLPDPNLDRSQVTTTTSGSLGERPP